MNDWKTLVAESGRKPQDVLRALMDFRVETPSWGYANTGTRFGKFLQAAAAVTLEHKIEDAAEVHRLTGIADRMAVHVLWDFPDGFDPAVVKLAADHGLAIGAINPNLFQDPCYKFGSLANPDDNVRARAIEHCLNSIEIGRKTGSNCISLWLADGTNYPGQDDMVKRRHRLEGALRTIYRAMPEDMTLLVEYKPFEPAFYQTDIPDWGAAALLAAKCGKRAKVLVDTGHHLPGTNVEQIVATLLDENLLGGFHFNDRKFADDDLTAGSISPYQLFLIFDQIVAARERGDDAPIAYMIDQSHNLKPKIEAMVQTVVTIQALYAKALLVNRKTLAEAQAAHDIVLAEETLREAFFADIIPMLAEGREALGVPVDPLAELRRSGTIEKRAAERKADQGEGASYV